MTPSNEFEMPGPDETTPPAGSVPSPAPTPNPIDPQTGPTRTNHPPSPNGHRPSSSPIPAILGAVLGLVAAGTLGAAWFLGYWPFEHKKPTDGTDHAAAVASNDTQPPSPSSSAVQADEDRVSRGEFDALSKRLDHLQARLDDQPKPSPVDLGPLQTSIDSLETLPGTVDDLTSKVKDLDSRTLKAETSIQNLRSRIMELQSAENKTADLTRAVLPEDELQAGIDLYHNRRYREARDVFDRLTQSVAPDDARAWYFDALATGLSTGDWKDAATRLALEGVKHEKAGSPSSDKIDDALEDLTEPTGRDWIASFRKRAKPQ